MPTLQETLDNSRFVKENVDKIWLMIADAVDTDLTLQDLDSMSRTSIEGLFLYIPAYVSAYFEEYVYQAFKADIQTIIDNNTNLNDRWLANEIKKFQDGDVLDFDDVTKRPFYSVIDPVKQILKYVSVETKTGLAEVKVAKEGKEKLTGPELSRLGAYLDAVRPAGSNISLVSLDPDKLKAPTKVYYNALRSEDYIKALVEPALLNYLDNLPYNGKFAISKWVDTIQAVPDVIDVEAGLIQVRPDVSPVFTDIDRVYTPRSGAIEIDSLFPLSSIITYEPISG